MFYIEKNKHMKKGCFFVFLVLLLCRIPAKAQVFFERNTAFAGSITSMITCNDGGFAYCGRSEVDSGNIVIARYNSSGVRQWVREYGSYQPEYPHDITQTADGGFVITGKQGYWEFTMLVMKVDSMGYLLWSNEMHNGLFDRANGVCATPDGGVVVVGRINNGLNYSAVAYKLSSSGVMQWGRSFSGFDDGGYSVIRTADGKFVMTGSASVGAALNIGVVKFDSTSVQWAISIGGANQEMTGLNHRLVQTQDGGFVICGMTVDQGTKIYTSKISSSGNFLWTSSFGTTSPVEASSMVASGNNVIICGNVSTGLYPSITYYPCTIKLNAAGNLDWAYQYPVAGSAIPSAMTLLPNGTLVQGGTFLAGANSGYAALSTLDLNGNACKIKSSFGGAVSASDYFPFVVSTSSSSLPVTPVWLNSNSLGSEAVTCSCGSSSPVQITSSSSSICYLGSAQITFPYHPGFQYSLYRNGVFVNSSGNSFFTITQGGNYFVVQQSGCSTDTSNTIHINVNSLPVASVSAAGRTKICAGQTVTLSASSTLGVNYQWLKNGGLIPGATLPTYAASQTGAYSVRVTNTGTGCSKTGNSVSVTVNSLPLAAVTANGPTSFCNGDSVVLQANSGVGYSYQWRKNGNPVAGATSINYSAKSAGTYKVKVTDANSCTQLSQGMVVSVPCRDFETAVGEVEVFPNPASGNISFVADKDAPVFYQLMDPSGRELLSGEWLKGDADLFVGEFAPGIYILNLCYNDQWHTRRLVIAR